MEAGKLTNTVEVYLPSILADNQNYLKLASQFVSYLEGQNPQNLFGSDSPYVYPDDVVDARLQHVHLLVRGDRYYKSKVLGKRTSDTILVYARDLVDERKCLLIALLKPGHKSQRNSELLRQFATVANRWRSRNEPTSAEDEFKVAATN